MNKNAPIKGHIISNGTHVVAIKSIDLAAAKKAAITIFLNNDLATDKINVVSSFTDDMSDISNDHEPSAFGVPDDFMITCGRTFGAGEEDDIRIDADAVISGFNIQSWSYVSPDVVFSHMAATKKPHAIKRHTPSREDKIAYLEAQVAALLAENAALKAQVPLWPGDAIHIEYVQHDSDGGRTTSKYVCDIQSGRIECIDTMIDEQGDDSHTTEVDIFRVSPISDEAVSIGTLTGDEHRSLEMFDNLDRYLLKLVSGTSSESVLKELCEKPYM